MKYIIFDIDGVLADCSHRLKYIKGEKKDYDKFYSYDEVLKDKVIEGGKQALESLRALESLELALDSMEYVDIAFVSARNEKCREATADWVASNFDGSYDRILMRSKNDWRPAHQVKEDLIKKHIGFENVLFAFDDDDKINEMYAKHGVMCYKPNIITRS